MRPIDVVFFLVFCLITSSAAGASSAERNISVTSNTAGSVMVLNDEVPLMATDENSSVDKGPLVYAPVSDTVYHGPGTKPSWYSPNLAALNILTEGFEHGGAIPPGWGDAPGVYRWLYNDGTDRGPGSAHSGSYAAYYNVYDYVSGSIDDLVTPSIDFSAFSGSYVLSFWSWHAFGADSMVVFVSENGVERRLYKMPNTSTWIQQVIPFTSTAVDGKILFRGYSLYGNNNIYIDDVSIDDIPAVGRCCYGDPFAPSCVDNSQSECNALNGIWNPTLNCAGSPCQPATPGENCAAAIQITGFPFTDSRNTADYNDDYNAHGKDVVYQFTIADSMLLNFSLCNTAVPFDTWMGVWAEGNCGTTDFIVYNDNGNCPASLLLSSINNLTLPPGTYYVLVEAFTNGDGNYTLDITARPPLHIPPNDECVNAQPINGPYPVTVSGTTVDATPDCPDLLDGSYVWYSIYLPYAVNEVAIDFCLTEEVGNIGSGAWMEDCSCSGYNIFNYSWPRCESGFLQLQLRGTITGPRTIYYPCFYSPTYPDYIGMDFTFSINVSDETWPGADFQVTAPGSWSGNTCGAGDDCALRPSEDQLWEVTIPYNATWTFSLCNSSEMWDSYIYLDRNPCLGNLASNDNACYSLSRFTVPLNAGTYYLTIEGDDPTPCGAYTLDIFEYQAPPNDDCANATNGGTLTPCSPIVFTGNNIGATAECPDILPLAEVWATFTLDISQDVTISYCGTNPKFPSFYNVLLNSCPCGDLVWQQGWGYDCADSNGVIYFDNLQPGQYWYPILSRFGVEGPYNITVTGTTSGRSACCYTPGDVNHQNGLNGLDVVYAVSYLKGGPAPLYSCECTSGNTWYVEGDVNGSCSFNGLDIVYMVNYFKGGPAPVPCPDCPPAGLLAPPAPGERQIPAVQPIITPFQKVKPKAGSME